MRCTICGNKEHGLCSSGKPSELVTITVSEARVLFRTRYHLLACRINELVAGATGFLYCGSCRHIFRPPTGLPRIIAFPGELGEWADREDAVGTLDDMGLKNWYEWWDKNSG